MPLVITEYTSKSIADKADCGFIMTAVTSEMRNDLSRALQRKGIPFTMPATHVLDIYKMRQGRYKNVRVWINLDLGIGFRRDLYMTTSENEPITYVREITDTPQEIGVEEWLTYSQK